MNDIIERSGELIVPATIVEKQLGKEWVAQTAIIQNTVHHVVPPELVRCKNCIRRGNPRECIVAKFAEQTGTPYFVIDNRGEWFCGDGKR